MPVQPPPDQRGFSRTFQTIEQMYAALGGFSLTYLDEGRQLPQGVARKREPEKDVLSWTLSEEEIRQAPECVHSFLASSGLEDSQLTAVLTFDRISAGQLPTVEISINGFVINSDDVADLYFSLNCDWQEDLAASLDWMGGVLASRAA